MATREKDSSSLPCSQALVVIAGNASGQIVTRITLPSRSRWGHAHRTLRAQTQA